MRELRPRHYARDILKLETLSERRAALEKVPDHLRGMVKTHMTNTWNINKSKRERHEKTNQMAHW